MKRYFQTIADRWNRFKGLNQLLQALTKPPDSASRLEIKNSKQTDTAVSRDTRHLNAAG
jgi:hypothetical protein